MILKNFLTGVKIKKMDKIEMMTISVFLWLFAVLCAVQLLGLNYFLITGSLWQNW